MWGFQGGGCAAAACNRSSISGGAEYVGVSIGGGAIVQWSFEVVVVQWWRRWGFKGVNEHNKKATSDSGVGVF